MVTPSDSFLTDREFENLALERFRFQFQNNPIYQKYCIHLNRTLSEVNSLNDIPFLPISFFKTQHVSSKPNEEAVKVFKSSGTTGMVTSSHYLYDEKGYKQNARYIFENTYGPLHNYCILALLPGYLERGDSSLVYMAADFIEATHHPHSGFYLSNFEKLKSTLQALKQQNQKTILLGVSYALLDFGEWANLSFPDLILMETGGMKGKRKEMVKAEFHELLMNYYGVSSVHAEYGMTELLSQAYSTNGGVFHENNSMRILIRDVSDPFNYLPDGKSGGINIIDLANKDSISFIETQDLGRKPSKTTFEVLGRFDNADLRGCNLLVA